MIICNRGPIHDQVLKYSLYLVIIKSIMFPFKCLGNIMCCIKLILFIMFINYITNI